MDGYNNSIKDWYVELQRSDMYWYELVVNGHDQVNTKKIIFDKLKALKNKVESNLEKRFIYFICSRKKVRFCTKEEPRFIQGIKKYEIKVKVGKEQKEQIILADALYDEYGYPAKVKIEETERFIYFCHHSGNKFAVSIHDFLLDSEINIGIETVVHYVGYTKNPNNRPLNGVHGGLSDILYKVSNEDNDILIFFNLFKVTAFAKNNEFNIDFSIANSMVDEIDVDKEGFVIEKSFIFYFDSDNQVKNKAKEKTEIENNLLDFIEKHNINSIQIHFEVDDKSEYYKFSSSKITAKHQHVFTAKLNNNSLLIDNDSVLFEKFIKSWL